MSSQPAHYRTRPREGLTPRQREVISLIARGQTNAQIADALGISLDGAKFHVSEIIARFGVESREQAAELWRQQRRPGERIHALFALPFGAKALGATVTAALVILVIGVAVALSLGGDDNPSPSLPDNEPTAAVSATSPTPGTPIADATPQSIDPATVLRPIRLVNVDTGEERTLPVTWGPMSWSPDGKFVAVSGESSTAIVETATGLVRVLSDRPSRSVAWSPGGERIAVSEYAVDLAGKSPLAARTAIFNPEGHLLHELAGAGSWLDWSPDGAMLASVGGVVPMWVWTGGPEPINLESGLQKYRWLSDGRLVAIEAVAGSSSPSRGVLLEFRAGSPGTFARVREVRIATYWPEVFITAEGDIVSNADEETVWTHLASPLGRSASWPGTSLGYIANAASWPASSGDRTLVVRGLCSAEEQLMVVGPDEASYRLSGGGVSSAAWAPDGSRIAITRGFELSVVQSDGSGERVVFTDVHAPAEPIWSPDGKWLAFVGFFGGWGRCD